MKDMIGIELSYKLKQGVVTYGITIDADDFRTLRKVESLKGQNLIEWFRERCPIRTLKRKSGETEVQVNTNVMEPLGEDEDDEGEEDELARVTTPSRLYA
jgi:hypothetical protein